MSQPRPLGAPSLLALGLNGVIGVGIFFAPSAVARLAPGWVGAALFAVTGALLLPVAAAFARLAAHLPEDGGPIVYARAAFGEGAAFLVGWISYLSAIASAAAVIAGLVHHGLGLSGAAERAAMVATALALGGVSALGLHPSAKVWTALTVLKLTPLVALAAWSLVARPTAPPVEASLPPLGQLARAALTVTFAFQGFEIVPLVSGQARSPRRAVPVAILGTMAIASLLYVLLQRAAVTNVADLAASGAPLRDAAGALGGAGFAAVVGVGASVTALGISFGMIVMTPRYLAGLGEAHVGPALARSDARGVPRLALAVSLALVCALLVAGSGAQLFALSSVAVLTQYGVTGLSLLALSLRRARGLRPAHAWPAPFVIAVGVVLVVFGGSRWEWLVAGGAVAVGAALRAGARALSGR
ncbi:MAG: APC family permease [Polyangiaceae bacterium]|nr:APC family permease [Polyangiaceae bacterium]